VECDPGPRRSVLMFIPDTSDLAHYALPDEPAGKSTLERLHRVCADVECRVPIPGIYENYCGHLGMAFIAQHVPQHVPQHARPGKRMLLVHLINAPHQREILTASYRGMRAFGLPW
jgi:hypothetical protein